MNRYYNGKIYKLTCENLYFIGITCTTLPKRLHYHKKNNVIFRDKPMQIELLKYVRCNNKKEILDAFEEVLNEHSMNHNCINNTRHKKRKYDFSSDSDE